VRLLTPSSSALRSAQRSALRRSIAPLRPRATTPAQRRRPPPPPQQQPLLPRLARNPPSQEEGCFSMVYAREGLSAPGQYVD